MKFSRSIPFRLGLLSVLALVAIPLAATAVVHPESAAPAVALAALPMMCFRKQETGGGGGSNANAELDSAALDAFFKSIDTMESEVNAMLAGMPPLEQFEASAELSYGFRSLKSYANNLKAFAENLKGKTASLKSAVLAECAANAEVKLLETGDFIRKVDSDAALQGALEKHENDVRNAILAERQLEATVAERRQELITKKTFAPEIVAAIAAELLTGDDWETKVQKVKPRSDRFVEAKTNLGACAEFVAELIGLPYDEAGEKTFKTRMDGVVAMASSHRPAGGNGDPARQPIVIPSNAEAATTGARKFRF